MAWTGLGRDAALLCSFKNRCAATAWLAAESPKPPAWVERMCAVDADDGVICLDDEIEPAAVFALLRSTGGHLVPEADTSQIPKLVNTIVALNGECAVACVLKTVSDAESWLSAPRLPRWLMSPGPAVLLPREAGGDEDVGCVAADGVIQLCDDEDHADDKKSKEFSAIALSLPPPPKLKRTLLSMKSLQDSMLLPVAFPRYPVTGALVHDRGAPPRIGVAGLGSDSSSSHLTPPSRVLLSPSVASRASRRRCQPGLAPTSRGGAAGGSSRGAARGFPSNAAAMSSTTEGTPIPARPRSSSTFRTASLAFSLTPAKASSAGASSSFSPLGSRPCSNFSALGSRPGSSSTPLGGRPSSSSAPLGRTSDGGANTLRPPQTCTPVPAVASPSSGRPAKKLRLSTAVCYAMARLERSTLHRNDGLFVTGGGGVGKTRLLRECVAEYRISQGGSRFGLHVVAPTGVAAAVAGGVTLHAFLRLPAGCFDESLSEEADAERLYADMHQATRKRLASTSVLLVDEVSMVSSRMFTLLCVCMDKAHAKHNPSRPWRIVAFGDFFQLPPVRRGVEDSFDTRGLYSFKSVYWARLFKNEQLQLRHVWRQEDKEFIEMLSHLRVGDVTDDLASFLQKRNDVYSARVLAGGLTSLDITHIFPHRERVTLQNKECLSTMEAINGCKREVYHAMDYPIGAKLTENEVTHQLNQALMAPETLEVCVGARVASCAKLTDAENEVPNGTVGVVVRFQAVPGHGSCGASDKVPVVRFDTVRGPVTLVAQHADMKLQAVARDGAYACRYQIPLVLAWAVTVHRCQGLSMDAAVMDLGPCFVSGMVYVALSRVRTMEGVHIISFDRTKVQADAPVICFYSSQRDLDHVFLDCVLVTGRA